MDKKRYQDLVNYYLPKESKLYNAIMAFLVGGLMGVLGHLLLELIITYGGIAQPEASTYMIIILIFIASLFTAFGFFDNLVKTAKAGLIIPITGFAHAMTSSALEYKNEGLVAGIGANMFKLAGSVIVFGIVAAYIFGLMHYLLLGV